MPPEEDRVKATGDLHPKFRKDRSSGSRDMLADRQTDTQTHRQTDRNTRLPYRGGVIIKHNARFWLGISFSARA